jgi:hypothetical protein
MRRRRVYDLVDLDGNVVMTDIASKLADYVGCEEKTIREYCSRGYVLDKRFKVISNGEYEKIREIKPSEPEPTYETNPYETLKQHLKAYGNAYCPIDPVPFFPWLLDEGLDCKCHEYQEFTTSNVSKRGRKPKPKYYYIVEVVNAKGQCKSI